MRKKILYLIVITAFVCSCKKLILNENPDYEGVWETECLGHGCDVHTLIIREDNTGEYRTSGQEIENVNYKGKVRIKDDVLQIGVKNKFNINEHPTAKNDTVTSYCQCLWGEKMVYSWYMIIDNITYYKE